MGRFIAILSVSICLIRILALSSPVLQFQLPVCVLLVLFVLIVVVLSGEPRQTKGKGWSTTNLFKLPPTPSNFIAGRPRAALFFFLAL